MKKAIIIPSNTDLNRGDQALVWESIRLVEEIYDKDVKCILMGDLDTKDSTLQNRQTEKLGYKIIDTILKHPGRKFKNKKEDSKSYSKLTLLQWGIQAVIDYCNTRLILSNNPIIRKAGILFLNNKQKETINEIKSADSIFVKGGGFIHSYGSITDIFFIYYLTYHIRLAESFGKKVIMLPNSIGPLKNKIARKIAFKVLKNCSLITVRETISKQYLDSFSINSELFPDLGFFLEPSQADMTNYLIKHNIPLNKKKVIITLRPYRFQGFHNPTKLFDNYINGVNQLVRFLTHNNYHVTFMAHTLGPSSHENDSLAIKEVLVRLDDKTMQSVTFIEDINLTCKEVEKIYSYYDYMIGTRFHSVIFALNVNVPSIAIAYGGNKGKGIMNVLGNSDYSIDMDKIENNSLINIFKKLEINKQNYLSSLKSSRIIINNQRKNLVKRVQTILK